MPPVLTPYDLHTWSAAKALLKKSRLPLAVPVVLAMSFAAQPGRAENLDIASEIHPSGAGQRHAGNAIRDRRGINSATPGQGTVAPAAADTAADAEPSSDSLAEVPASGELLDAEPALQQSASARQQSLPDGRGDLRVAITFDDLPFADAIGATGMSPAAVAKLNNRLLHVLRTRRVPATGFVVQTSVDAMGSASKSVLAAWARPPFGLGNHGMSHADFNMLQGDELEREIVGGEPAIREALALYGRAPAFIRFPKNHLGETPEKIAKLQGILKSRGLKVAASTIDTSDYIFESAYSAAISRQDHACAASVRQSYLDYTAYQIDYYAGLGRRVLGYAPPEIALLHANRINADTLADILTLYSDRGYRFITLEEAQADPAYDDVWQTPTRFGPMWGYRWARTRHITLDFSAERDPPNWLSAYAAEPGAGCSEALK